MSSNPPPAVPPIANPPWLDALSGLAPYSALIPNPLVAAGVGVLLKYGPEAFGALINLIHNQNPTKEDWLALLKSADAKSYDDYIAEAKAAAGK